MTSETKRARETMNSEKKEAGFDGPRGRQKTALKARAVSRSRQTNHKVPRIFISAIFETSLSVKREVHISYLASYFM